VNVTFYLAAVIALLATLRVITCSHAVHALLYFIVSLFAVAVVFFVLGAPFVAALEIIIYAGAIMVLFLFVVMLLNQDPEAARQARRQLTPRACVGPIVLAAVLVGELIFAVHRASAITAGATVGPRDVGLLLFGRYMLGVEMASFLLLAGLVGAYHLGRRPRDSEAHE
jgi:NADH-quinone oxidoreductase subunit J